MVKVTNLSTSSLLISHAPFEGVKGCCDGVVE